MKTSDIPTQGPSDWRHEPNPANLAVIGKLGEEAGELAARCCRSVIQGVYEADPDDGRDNLAHLIDEMADVAALITLVWEQLDIPDGAGEDRMERKVAYKRPWIVALRP